MRISHLAIAVTKGTTTVYTDHILTSSTETRTPSPRQLQPRNGASEQMQNPPLIR